MSEPTGEIRFLFADDSALTVEHADAVMWFAQITLQDLQKRPDPSGGWTFNGSLITLNVANGRWVWKLTGREWQHNYGPGTMPLVMLEAVWPD